MTMLGMKINYQDPRYQRMVQQAASVGPWRRAIMDTAMADSAWARNRQNLALDWYNIGTQRRKAEHDISMGRARLAEAKRSNLAREEFAKQALKNQRKANRWALIGGFGKLGLGALSNNMAKQRQKKELARMTSMQDAAMKYYGAAADYYKSLTKGQKQASNYSGKGPVKTQDGYGSSMSNYSTSMGLGNHFGMGFKNNPYGSGLNDFMIPY